MTILYSGEQTQRGVAVTLDEETSKSLKEYWAVSPRLMLVKLQTKSASINSMQGYVPTQEHTKEDMDLFYKQLEKTKKACRSQEASVVMALMGDITTKIGKLFHLL